MLWLAAGFVAGLALGFPLGVITYLATYSLFQKDNDARLRKRIALVQQQAIALGRDQANKLHRMRSLHGDRLDASEQPTEEMEDILGTGPTGGKG